MADLHQPATDPNQAILQRLSDLESRLDQLRVANLVIATGAGPPSTSPANGTLYIDTTNFRLYFRYSGAWHYVAQTA